MIVAPAAASMISPMALPAGTSKGVVEASATVLRAMKLAVPLDLIPIGQFVTWLSTARA